MSPFVDWRLGFLLFGFSLSAAAEVVQGMGIGWDFCYFSHFFAFLPAGVLLID